MAIDKVVTSLDAALEGINDGSTLTVVGGFGGAGAPTALLDELADRRLRGLTVISNNAGSGTDGLAALLVGRGGSSRLLVPPDARFSGV